MVNAKWEAVQSLKNDLFATRTESDFNAVVEKIGETINSDPTFTEQYRQKVRDYVHNLKAKKQEYWKRYGNKPAYTKKEVYLLRPETEIKLQQLLDVLIAKHTNQ